MEGLVQQHIEGQLLNAAKAIEDRVDNQLHHLEKLDGDDYERLREQRLADIKRKAKRRQQWLTRGHGEYREVPSEKEFFAEMKGEERMVCHFFRDSWPCKVMDSHLQRLAASHVETKFVKINAEKSPFLTDRLKIWMLPTLALVRHEKTVDYVVGFEELGGSDDFLASALVARLQAVGLLMEPEAPPPPPPRRSVRQGGSAGAGAMRVTQSDEDSDFSD